MESKRYAHKAALATCCGILLLISDTAFGDSFRRVSTFSNYTNNTNPADETVSEIVAATPTGKLLVYTDGALEQIGFVDIVNPAKPLADGKLDIGGEPTSVAVLSERYALVGVNTSQSLQQPSGYLAVVDLITRSVVRTIDLGGQPDSVAVSPSRRYAAIAIENERDEDVVVDGVEGGLPQYPAGFLSIVDLVGPPQNWRVRAVDLTGYSAYAPTDPEPEFVSINKADRAVVTLQENNHAVVVNLRTGKVQNDIELGSVDLKSIDATEDGVIALTETLLNVAREPDAVTWLPGGRAFATANEGDLFGGSRGFSIFTIDGRLRYDSGSSFDALAVQHGHYPEDRSENKGSEPEAITYGKYGSDDLLFVGSERGSFVAVYKLAGRDFSRPRFSQLLPAPLAPEGLLAIPSRNLLVVAGEADDPEFGVRSSMMIYEYQSRRPNYPEVVSKLDGKGNPVAWGALSGMVASGGPRMLAVSDSFYANSSIFELARRPNGSVVRSQTPIQGGTGNFDPEGIAIGSDSSYWIASEGNRSSSRPNRLLQTDPQGLVMQEVELPPAINACRLASDNRDSLGAGFEGVTLLAGDADTEGDVLLVAQQRGWDYTTVDCEALDDDSLGMSGTQPRATRLWTYSVATGEWDHIVYELAAIPDNASWVGLSEVTALPDGSVLLIERDNLTGDAAQLKTVVRVSAAALADKVIEAREKQIFDMLPQMRARKGLVSDKPEGLAVINGKVLVVTDNDGVDDWSGETSMLQLGSLQEMFTASGNR